jgi:non-ribosomal peptide synthetase component F
MKSGEPLGWARSPVPTGPPSDPKNPGLWLVCADGLGLGARIVRRLAAGRVPAATVVPGAAFARLGERAWTLPPGDREGCVALLAELGERPAVLLHLWALAPEAGLRPSADLFTRLESSEEAGPRSLRSLLWALAGPPAGDPVRVLVVADRMQQVLRGEAVDPVRSALSTLCAAVSAAYPELRCRTADVLPPPPGAQRKAWIEATSSLLIAEARHGAEPAVAYRSEERWEPLRGEAPETDLERALAEIWRELLGGPPVRRREGFFERGGDSRSAVLLSERLREKLGVTLPLAEILAAPTVAGLAEAVETIARRTRERGARPETASSTTPPPAAAPTPPPRLPVADAGTVPAPQPATLRLETAAWRRLRERGARRAIAPAGLLLAALGDVIATWNDGPAFAVAVPGTGLVEIDATAPGDFTERARSVQGRLWGALAAGAPAPSDWPVAFSFGPLESPAPRGAALLCRAGEADGALVLRWETDPARLSPETSGAMLGALRDHLLRLAASEGGEAAWSDERRRLIPPQQLARRILAGGPGSPLPRERLEALVAAQAEAGPDRPALVTPDRTLSYGELLERGQRFGRRLRELGAGPGVPVAVVLEPGETAAVAILGVLSAGAAWVPVDPGLPARRLREILTEHLVTGAGLPALAVTTRETEGSPWPPEVTRILLDEGSGSDGASHRPPPSAADLACILPLLGQIPGPSAMIEHRGAANALLEAARIAGLGPEDRLLALSPLGDPLALCELFGPLTWGGAVAVPDTAGRAEPARWPELIRRRGVTAWASAPEPLARLLAAARHAGAGLPLRAVLVSGRELPAGLAERLRAVCPEARLTRLTPVPEAPLWAAAAPLRAPSAHYGQPLANLTLHILDPRLEPRPDGVPGALFLGGPGLARGYWRDPAGSAARFLVHPDTGERLFRTGETARVRPDGEVETLS